MHRALRFRAAVRVTAANEPVLFLLGSPGLQRSISGEPWIDPQLQDETLALLRAGGARRILVLCEPEELPAGGDDLLAAACRRHDLQRDLAPIPDYAAPDSHFQQRWLTLCPTLHAALDRGESLGLSCLFGAGRSGTIAAFLLIERGATPSTALARVRHAYPPAVESDVQATWLARQR